MNRQELEAAALLKRLDLKPADGPWPTWANALAKLRTPEDIGLGDTAARVIDKFGGRIYKAAMKAAFGGDCSGCAGRQTKLNEIYSYRKVSP